jgi:8-oxo-dGTP diphosphatase
MSKKHSYPYPLPALTVDTVIFTIAKGRLRVLLIKRGEKPFKGNWAIPGGFVEVGGGYAAGRKQGEGLDAAAARELQEETGLDAKRDGVFLEQLYTFGTPGRDPRGRVVSVAYYALVSPDVSNRIRPGDDAAEADWLDVPDPTHHKLSLAFDHDLILQTALDRIRGKIDYDPRIARGLLSSEFTQKEFRRVHEIVKGETYDRSNFAKRFRRLLTDGLFVPVGTTRELRGAGKPPKLYRFAK